MRNMRNFNQMLTMIIRFSILFTFVITNVTFVNAKDSCMIYRRKRADNVLSKKTSFVQMTENDTKVTLPVTTKTEKLDDNSFKTESSFTSTLKNVSRHSRKMESLSNTEDDNSFSVTGTITIYYDKIGATANYSTRYKLTKVSYKWNVHNSQVKISNRFVKYTCQAPLDGIVQTGSKKLTNNSGSFNTGFTKYAQTTCGAMAAYIQTTCTRGTGSWKFKLEVIKFNNVPGLSEFI